MRAIVYTRHDGGVSVNTGPSAEVMRWMQFGGCWDDHPHGFLDEQIERQIGSGIAPDHARRFARAVAFGGVTEPEAWEIIRDRDCARHGVMHDMIDTEDLPGRWFRDAWSRSSNGGPVVVSLEKAKPIQWGMLMRAVLAENKRRELDLYGGPSIKVPKISIQSAIKNARDVAELERVWLPSLPRL